jgi:hypothetical protein
LNNSNIGLSLGAQAAFTGFAVAARFNPSGDIDARNGGAFVAASTIPYTAGTSYHFRAVVNVPANTYSMYVTPAGQAEITVGTNYSFRAEQAGITSIDHWDATSEVGTITLCNMVVETPNFSVSSPPISQTVTAGTAATYTTTITPIGGYTGSVALSAAGLPSGATASFNPATVAVAVSASVVTSTMTVATTASTATGIYPITVTATDGTLTNTAYPELTINPPCLAPTATSQKITVPENGAVAITLAGTLGSGCAGTDTLSSSVTVNPSHGVLTGTAPNLFYTPTGGFSGADSFSFTVTDAKAVTATSSAATVTVTVAAPVSGAPVLSSLAPAVVVAGSTGIVLTVNGSGFTSGSTVLWNGASRTTTYVSSTQLTEAVMASDISASGLASITVSTSGTSGVSAPLTLAIDSNKLTSLTAMTTSYTVAPGLAATAQLTFGNLPAGALTLADCYNLPAGVNCSYNAQTERLTLTTGESTPAGTYQILVVGAVTPQTTASVSGHSSQSKLWSCLLGLPFGWMWLGRKRRRRWLYPTAGILGLFLVLMVGCSSGTAPASTASTQASMTLTLTVT